MKSLSGLLVLIVLTLAAYYPAIEAGLILDDELFYLNDPLTTASDGLLQIWLHPLENNKIWSYVPISRSTFWLEKQVWGTDIRVSHGINVFFHLLSAILLWRALQHSKIKGAWLIGVLFALHPVHVQSVVWIAERRNVVASIFYISALWSYLCFEQKRRERLYWLALVLFSGALLSKTSTIMLPLVLIFCRLWFHAEWKKPDLIRLLPFFLLALAVGVIRIWFETTLLGANNAQVGLNFGERLSLAGHIPFFYLSKLIFPYPLIFTYPKWNIDLSYIPVLFPLISSIGIMGFLLWKYQSWGRPIFLGLGAFGTTLFPVLGFFNIAWTQFSFVTDHWAYLPSLPILILEVQGLLWLTTKINVFPRNRFHPTKWTLWSILFIILGNLTWNQALVYQNQKTLWSATIRHNPDSWLAHTVLGEEYLKEKNYQRTIEHSDTALQLKPDNLFAFINRGLAHFHRGQIEPAIQDFSKALQIDPESVEASFNRGMAYAWSQHYVEATEDYSRVLKIEPNHLKGLYNRASLYFRLKQYEKAISDYNAVLKLNSQLAEAYYNRGVIYFFMQKYEQSLADNNQTLKLAPDHSEARKMQETLSKILGKKKD